jgi:hypothetical protein
LSCSSSSTSSFPPGLTTGPGYPARAGSPGPENSNLGGAEVAIGRTFSLSFSLTPNMNRRPFRGLPWRDI